MNGLDEVTAEDELRSDPIRAREGRRDPSDPTSTGRRDPQVSNRRGGLDLRSRRRARRVRRPAAAAGERPHHYSRPFLHLGAGEDRFGVPGRARWRTKHGTWAPDWRRTSALRRPARHRRRRGRPTASSTRARRRRPRFTSTTTASFDTSPGALTRRTADEPRHARPRRAHRTGDSSLRRAGPRPGIVDRRVPLLTRAPGAAARPNSVLVTRMHHGSPIFLTGRPPLDVQFDDSFDVDRLEVALWALRPILDVQPLSALEVFGSDPIDFSGADWTARPLLAAIPVSAAPRRWAIVPAWGSDRSRLGPGAGDHRPAARRDPVPRERTGAEVESDHAVGVTAASIGGPGRRAARLLRAAEFR